MGAGACSSRSVRRESIWRACGSFPAAKSSPARRPSMRCGASFWRKSGSRSRQPRPLLRLRHTYSHGEVLLDVWVVRRYRGEPRSLDGQALRWCSRASLGTAELLPADRPIIGALRLPERLRVRETPYYRIRDFVEFMAEGLGGAKGSGGVDALRGVSCGTVEAARAAVSAGADFVALERTPRRARARRVVPERQGAGVRASVAARAGVEARGERRQCARVRQ